MSDLEEERRVVLDAFERDPQEASEWSAEWAEAYLLEQTSEVAQFVYRNFSQVAALHHPFSLDELMEGYDEAPEGLSGWPHRRRRIAAD